MRPFNANSKGSTLLMCTASPEMPFQERLWRTGNVPPGSSNRSASFRCSICHRISAPTAQDSCNCIGYLSARAGDSVTRFGANIIEGAIREVHAPEGVICQIFSTWHRRPEQARASRRSITDQTSPAQARFGYATVMQLKVAQLSYELAIS